MGFKNGDYVSLSCWNYEICGRVTKLNRYSSGIWVEVYDAIDGNTYKYMAHELTLATPEKIVAYILEN